MALGRQFLPVLVGDALGALQLLAGGQQPGTVQLGPAVELAGGEFDEVRFQLDAQLDDPLDAVDVVPVGDEVEHHRVALGLHRAGHGQLLGEGLGGSGQQVVHLLVGGLEADLDMVQAGVLEGRHARFAEADAGGDQVGVVTQFSRGADQFLQVLAHQRLAAGKAQLRGAQFAGLAEHLDPLRGGQFLALPGEVQRVGAVGALQRAAVGQLGQQPERRPRLCVRLRVATRTGHGPPR
ncbi:hypothetical protein D3C80_1120420 [compost metagenome]